MCACTDDVQSEYSGHRAFFRYPMVQQTPELRTALNDPGMFCAITFPPNYYRFTDINGRFTQMNRTSLEAYGKPVFISGFLVGTPILPDMSGRVQPVAYDLVCPNCYVESFIERALSFKTTTEMQCGRCGRVYDLSNNGIVKSEGGGRPIFRYRMTYSATQGVLVISN